MKSLNEMCFEQIKVKNGKCVEYGMMREGVYERLEDEMGEELFDEEKIEEIGLDDGVWMVVASDMCEEDGGEDLSMSEVDMEYVDECGGWEGYIKLED